jgi:hypothetical protein
MHTLTERMKRDTVGTTVGRTDTTHVGVWDTPPRA